MFMLFERRDRCSRTLSIFWLMTPLILGAGDHGSSLLNSSSVALYNMNAHTVDVSRDLPLFRWPRLYALNNFWQSPSDFFFFMSFVWFVFVMQIYLIFFIYVFSPTFLYFTFCVGLYLYLYNFSSRLQVSIGLYVYGWDLGSVVISRLVPLNNMYEYLYVGASFVSKYDCYIIVAISVYSIHYVMFASLRFSKIWTKSFIANFFKIGILCSEKIRDKPLSKICQIL